MNRAIIFKTIGSMLLLIGATMVAPLVVALLYTDDGPFERYEAAAFAFSIAATLAAGLVLRRLWRTDEEVGIRDALVVVPIAWVVVCAFGALPYLISGTIGSVTEAYFESMSGFTTTGATVIPDVEIMPHGILLWRSMTHWLGGMGIVMLFLVIMPSLGTGGYMLMKAEVRPDRMMPRARDTARTLWLIYLVLTAAHVLLLLPSMNLFEAVCHAFSTMATGGFSTRNASVGAFNSAYVDAVVTLFMFLAGTNFLLHYQFARTGNAALFWKNPEFRNYALLILGAAILITATTHGSAALAGDPKYGSILGCFRYAAFQVTSLSTATGYATADYDLWPNLCRFTLYVLMFVGACSGSTGGGIKNVRILLFAKYALREVQRVVRPNAVFSIRFGVTAVEERTMHSIIGFIALFIGIYVIGVLGMCMVINTGDLRWDLETAMTSVITCMSNIGPGMAAVGPSRTMHDLPAIGKWILTAAMLVGRLEIYSVLVLLSPFAWKK